MNKSYDVSLKAHEKELSAEDLALINRYTQKELTADELFTFSVILCDNEIDRDFERFSVEALEKLAKLFVGKTAIKNHSMNSEDQSARTYKTEVVTDKEKLTSTGEAYTYVKAYCYMPKIKKNEDRYNAALLEKKVEAFFEKNPQKRELLHSIGPLSLGDM